MPRTIDEVFQEYRGRRQGMLRALTTEKIRFFQLCDPAHDNLCLYSYPDGTWEVSGPAPEVPSELPEPCLGVNCTRDGMPVHDWLTLVAAHSDSWLFAVAYFYSAKFNKQQRADLFDRINGLSTVFEVVRGQGSAMGNGLSRKEEHIDERFSDEKENEEEDGGGEDEEEDEEAYCGACQGSYSTSSNSQFWIFCDICKRWYHGRCVKITAARAQQIQIYRCPSCARKRPLP